MYRIDNSTAVPHASGVPAPAAVGPKPDGYFTKGNPGGGVAATIVDDDWANAVQEEISAVIEAAGLVLSKTTRNQLLSSLSLVATGFRNVAVYMIISGTQKVSINGAAFTATGATTFAAPVSGVAKVRAWGAGGGAGGCTGTTSAGAAGGGGEYAEGILTALSGSTTITVGAGGTAGSSTGPTAGGGGGTTSFGALLTAVGGGGGLAGTAGFQATAASGGTGGSGGTLRIAGGQGNLGYTVTTGTVGGAGGATWAGVAPIPVVTTVANAGVAALFPGGGAGCAINNSSGSAGASGCVIVEY